MVTTAQRCASSTALLVNTTQHCASSMALLVHAYVAFRFTKRPLLHVRGVRLSLVRCVVRRVGAAPGIALSLTGMLRRCVRVCMRGRFRFCVADIERCSRPT